MEALPTSVDVIVLGTGLPESILAGACARSGLSILHLDRNNYYGGGWSSFNLKTVDDWIQSVNNSSNESHIETKVELDSGESLVRLGKKNTVKNLKCEWKSESEATTSVKSRKGDMEEMTYRTYLDQEWRRFSIDLVPKVIVADSPMVQTLVDSEVSKYAEFKMIDRFLCMERKNNSDGLNYCPVPCSRSEIFQSKHLSMIDKRRLMMFMDFIQKWRAAQDPELNQPLNDRIYDAFKNKPFEQFLESDKFQITDKLRYFITDAIGILHPNATTEEGLEAVCMFINSTGRFGSSPFLFPLYGCGELPQCFCRLAAVFGGLYCLNRPIESLILKENRVTGIVAAGQRISCSTIIMSNEYIPQEFIKENATEKWINRAVHITHTSIQEDLEGKERISLVNLSPLNRNLAARLFEAGFEAASAPKGYYVLHFTGNGDDESGLHEVEKVVFSGEKHPTSLWRLQFSSMISTEYSNLPENVAVVPGADETLEYGSVLELARKIFKSFWKDIDFLPKVLQPVEEEQTILDTDTIEKSEEEQPTRYPNTV